MVELKTKITDRLLNDGWTKITDKLFATMYIKQNRRIN
jgi:hypothetical protein